MAATARQQASEVVDQGSIQVSKVVDDVKDRLREQAHTQTDQLGQVLGLLAGRIEALTDGRPEDAGPVADLARQAAGHVRQMARRAEDGGVEGAAADVKRFARRRPGVFVAGAVTAGFAVGRLLRAGKQSGSLGAAVSGTPPTQDHQATDPSPGTGTTEIGTIPAALEAPPRTVSDVTPPSTYPGQEVPR